ncbi:MAG: DUF2721 domain-containing protein [Thermoanaerobaculia bacterium]
MAGAASEVLSGMITPALLISASGTLVLSTSNRLSRVVDRVRVLTAEAERSQAADATVKNARRSRLIARQLEHLASRALLLRASMTALYASIGLLIATSIGVGFAVLLELRYWVPVALALSGACSLLYGSLLLVREARAAVVSTLEEMAYARSIVSGEPEHPIEAS